MGLWLHWATVPPFLHRAGEDAAWVAHVARLLNWVADGLDATTARAGVAGPAQKALRQRLLARGRESLADIDLRLARNARFADSLSTAADVFLLDNSGQLEHTVERLLGCLDGQPACA